MPKEQVFEAFVYDSNGMLKKGITKIVLQERSRSHLMLNRSAGWLKSISEEIAQLSSNLESDILYDGILKVKNRINNLQQRIEGEARKLAEEAASQEIGE